MQIQPLPTPVKLVDARKRKNFTQEQLEALTGASQSFISKLENGHCPDVVAMVLKIARALDVSVEELFGAAAIDPNEVADHASQVA